MLHLFLALLAAPDRLDPNVAEQARQIGGAINAGDYPAAALEAQEEGSSALRLRIGADGRVTGCEVAAGSGSAVLDATACALVRRRFRYKPARDAAGAPVATRIERRVTWRLPKDDLEQMAGMLPAFAAGEMRISMAQDSVGIRCAVETFGGAATQMTACPEEMRVPARELERDPSAIMTVVLLEPAGEETAARPPIRGTLMSRSASDIEVGADGRLRSCRDMPGSGSGEAAPSFCQAMNHGMPAFRPAASAGPRRARITLEVYRLGAPET